MAGLNPFDAGGKSESANPFDAPKAKRGAAQQDTNPFDAGVKKVGAAVAGGLSTAGRVLDAPGYGVRRALTGEADTDKQMTKERKFLGIEGAYKSMPHFLQGTVDTLLQTAQDPLLLAGPLAKGLGLGVKAAGLIEKTAPGRILQDATMWGAKVGRTHGPEARDVARSAANIGSSSERSVAAGMQRRIDKARGALSDEEKMNVDRALNGEIDRAALSVKEAAAHKRLQQITDLDYRLRTGVNPKNAKTGLDAPYYENYLPGVHRKSLEAENRAATTYNRLDPFDPRNIERDPFKVESAEMGDKGFAAMAKNTGRQVGAQKIKAALGELADSPEVQKLFDVKMGGRGAGRTDLEKFGSGVKSVVGYPRAAIVSLTPRHAGNILNLLANTDPGALPEAMNLARKLAVADDKTYARLVKEGVDMGAVSGDFIERKPFFAHVPGLGKWTTAMNKITWAVDDAAKTVYAKRIAAKGGNKLAAGGRSARELVDYANVAPITEAARYVAPFATFRTSIPGAVAGGVARNPGRAAFLNRATGGTMYGGETDTPWGKAKMYNPTADIGRMDPQGYARGSLGDVPRMALNQTGMAPASKTGRAQKDWWTYGEGLFPFKDHNGRWHLGSLADYAAAGLPLSSDVIEQAGLGAFRPKDIGRAAMQKIFGVGLR